MENIVSVYYMYSNKNIDIDNMKSILNDDDLVYINKAKTKEVYNERVVSSYLKRKYIKQYKINEFGKPISNNINFNVSHSGGLVLLATCNFANIGIDVEHVTHANDDIKKYISNEDEYKMIKDDLSFYKIWTSKESLVKASGKGINKKPNMINSLPLVGIKQYEDNIYYSKQMIIDDYVISITVNTNKDFKIIIKEG